MAIRLLSGETIDGGATFVGKINITQNSGDFILENTGSGHASLTTGSSKDLNISSASGNVYINTNTTFAGTVAVNGDFFLDVKNPKLLKKVRRYYENNGVVFSGDALDDYDILMEQISVDLEAVEA